MGKVMGSRLGGHAMAKTTERFSALKIANLKGPGYFADGGNLYFRVAPGGARRLDFSVHHRGPDA